jgi:hypothetical protein
LFDLNKKYFYQSFILLILSGLVFVVLKKSFPKSTLENQAENDKLVIKDSLMIKAIQEEEKLTAKKDSIKRIRYPKKRNP